MLVERGVATRDPRTDALEAGGSVLCCEFEVNALRNRVSGSVWCVLWFMVLGLDLLAVWLRLFGAAERSRSAGNKQETLEEIF